MSFAKFAKMSSRDRMLAGLRGLTGPTRGLEYHNARGVRLGMVPLAGLGLATEQMMMTAATGPAVQAQPTFAPTLNTDAPAVSTSALTTATFSPSTSFLAPATTVNTLSPSAPTAIAPQHSVPTYSAPPIRNVTTALPNEPAPRLAPAPIYQNKTAPTFNPTTAYAAPTPAAVTPVADEPYVRDTKKAANEYARGTEDGAPGIDAEGNYVTAEEAATRQDESTIKTTYFPIGDKVPKQTKAMVAAAQKAAGIKPGIKTSTWMWIGGAALLTFLAFKDSK